MTPTDGYSSGPSGKSRHNLMREATEWFMRQSASDLSPEQRAQFEVWRRENPAHDRAFNQVSALWDSSEMDLAARRIADTTDAGHLGAAPSRGWSIRLRTAAIAATIALVSFVWWFGDALTRLNADYVTAVGERRVVTLPDRSVATLNTNSAIAVRYEAGRRVIRLLRGEAAFSVQPDKDRPFAVETRGVTATALGTEFLVRDLPRDVQVTVLHGSVKVTGGTTDPTRSVRVNPGEQVIVGSSGPGTVTQIDPTSSAAWMQDRLVFVRAPLADVVQELSRYHRGYLAIWNPSLNTLPVTGIYSLKAPQRVITTLAETLPIHMVRLTDHIIVIR